MLADLIDRIVLVPRWSGTAGSDWYPWLRARLDVRVETVPLLPEPGAPDVATTVAAVSRVLGDDPAVLTRTIVIGHSVGVQAAMRALAGLADGIRVRALVGVAGWWTVDRPWASLMPWQEPFAFERVRGHVDDAVVVISDDDPFTSDPSTTVRLFETRIGARVTVVPGGKHFNRPEEPCVLDALG